MNLIQKAYQRIFIKRQFGYLREFKHLARYEIGEWTHGHSGLQVLSPEGGTLKIGRFCSIARGVTIVLGGEHRKDWISTFAFPLHFQEAAPNTDFSLTKGNVTIGNDVWIGINSIVMSGVTLGDGMIVGAGSVVRRSFPPYSIVAGNPASLAGYRFPKEIIEELMLIRWWDWPINEIRKAFPLVLSDRVEQFASQYRVSPLPPVKLEPAQCATINLSTGLAS